MTITYESSSDFKNQNLFIAKPNVLHNKGVNGIKLYLLHQVTLRLPQIG